MNASRQNSKKRMHAACRIMTRGSCCTKNFAEFDGNCESYCSLEQLVTPVCAAHKGIAFDFCYALISEDKRHRKELLVQTSRFAVL